jgi:hypothetical protein
MPASFFCRINYNGGFREPPISIAMRRSTKGTTPRLSAESQRLINHARAVLQSSSRLEERGWERELDILLLKALKNHHQDQLDGALEYLFREQPEAYDVLIQAIEGASESCVIEHEGTRYEALLIAAPILAWTRFAIPAGAIAAEMLTTLFAHLHAHVLAPDTRLAIAPMLYSIDQLPRNHVDTFAATQRMAHAAVAGTSLRNPANPPETVPFLADTRYLLAVIAAPAGEALFRWQATGNLADRDNALAQWRLQATPNVARLLPGCGIELLLPDAYFAACREADKQIRPASVKAAVHYLTHSLNVGPERLSAVIGGFADESSGRIDEYRVSFVLRPGTEVVYGLVWPLYDDENAEQEFLPPEWRKAAGSAATKTLSPIQEIMQLLHEAGIAHVKRHEEPFPMDFCEDCGAPLYCDLEGELVHAEMPEDTPHPAPHLH